MCASVRATRAGTPLETWRELDMVLALGDNAPDFEADTTEGTIRFHEWIGDSLGDAVLAPEGLHAGVHDRARLHGEDQAGIRQAQREDHRAVGRSRRQPRAWAKDIADTQGHAPNYPIIGDPDFNVSKLYGMLPASASAIRHAHRRRQPDRAQRVRDRSGQEDQAHPRLSDDHGPQLRRGAARDRLAAAHREAQGRHAGRTGSRART